MDITGKLLEKYDTQQVTDRFQKREFVIEFAENPQYPEFVKFELIQDRVSLIDSFEPGQSLKVHFNLKGRKWTDRQGEVKYFNSLQAWRVEGAEAGSAGAPPAPDPEAYNNNNLPDPGLSAAQDGEDDLPF